MRKSIKRLTAAALVAVALGAVPLLFAATHHNNAAGSGNMGHMMQGQDGAEHGMNMMGDGAMPMMKMMSQMSAMMATCAELMQSHMKSQHDSKNTPSDPADNG